MDTALRSIKLSTGHTLTVWDAQTRAHTGQHQLRYTFLAPFLYDWAKRACKEHGAAGCSCPPEYRETEAQVLFCGSDYGVSPMHSVDSDAALLGLLGFLTLRPGDTDSEYFTGYTPAQLAWAQSSACEELVCEVSLAEEIQGCACILWENLDGWECEDAGNVVDFEVLDHGEDGSQYFPGCGVYGSKFDHVATGVGDTGAEAFADALEQMASSDPEARMSKLQEHWARQSLSNPDKSAFESLDHSECGKDHDGDDWAHRVSIRYTVRG